MVLVTVGNATQDFSRLLSAVDQAAGSGLFGDENVIMQSGNSTSFRAHHCRQESFIEMEKFEELLGRASLVIAHGGAGTLIHVFRARKVPIVMPRRMEYGEHIDDHQTELIEVLARDGRVIPVSEAEDLPQAVSQARSRNIEPRPEKTPPLVGLVAEAIRQLTEERS